MHFFGRRILEVQFGIDLFTKCVAKIKEEQVSFKCFAIQSFKKIKQYQLCMFGQTF